MPNRRRENRKHLIFYLKIIDTKDKRELGQLVDISATGLRMVSGERMEVGKYYNLSISLPQACFAKQPMRLEAECIWSNEDIRPGQFLTGFRISDLSLLGDMKIENIIASLFRDYVFEN